MSVEEQVDKLLQKKPVKKHFNHKLLVGFGAFVVTVLVITLAVIPVFQRKERGFDAQEYLVDELNKNRSDLGSHPAYSYWYPPNNSFGIGTQVVWNNTWVKNKIANNVDWMLETNTGSGWYFNNDSLNVGLRWNETGFYKLWFNVTNLPLGNHRITFYSNIQNLSSMINKTDDEIWIYYPVGNETLRLMFNYSDLKGLGLTFRSGKYNDYWYFRFRKDSFEGNYSFDPTFGHIGEEAGLAGCEGIIYGFVAIPVSNGTANSISVYIDGTNHKTKCAIYDNTTLAFLMGTEEKILTGNTLAWVTYNLTSGLAINTSTEYLICAWGNSTGGTVRLRYVAGTGYVHRDGAVYNGWPNPTVQQLKYAWNLSIYCSYTVSGITWQVVNESINGTAYNTTAWQVINESINGSAYNQTSWSVINESINGTAYNQTSWTVVNESINGTAYNTSAVSWQVVNSTINGSAYNQTGWSIINSSINGTAYNSTTWQVISNAINGSAYNDSVYWKVVNSSINGSCYNTSIPSAFNITLEYPNNESNIYSIQPTVYFNLTHPDGYTMNYSLYIDNTTLIHSGVNVSDGTQVDADHLFYSANTTYTSFYWRVAASDGHGNWVNNTYNFQAILQGGGGITGYGAALAIATGAIMLSVVGLIGINEKKKRRGRI